MAHYIEQTRRIGWLIAEAGVLIIVLCLVLNILLGAASSGEFVSGVAGNATTFLQGLPSGVMAAFGLIAIAYALLRPRLAREH